MSSRLSHTPPPPLPSGAPALPAKRPSVPLLQTPPPASSSSSPHSPLPLSPFSFSPGPIQPPPSNPAASSPPDTIDLPPIKLYTTREQRDLSEQLADLYSLLLTIEHVETAYVRDAITNQKDYTTTCNRLLAQYKTLHEALGKDAPDLAHYCHSLSIHANKAISRLRVGVPATTLHGGGGGGDGGGGGSSLVFRAAQSYITLLDALKLGMRAVDQLVPLLTDAMSAVNQVSDMPAEHEARVGVRQWLVLLSGMRAHEELTSEQARQCEFDMQKAYDAAYRFFEDSDKKKRMQH